jgi:hypothetical protein
MLGGIYEINASALVESLNGAALPDVPQAVVWSRLVNARPAATTNLQRSCLRCVVDLIGPQRLFLRKFN